MPDTPEPSPYNPSWVDRLTGAIERLPIPSWLAYLVLLAVEVAIIHVVAWGDGWGPPFQFEPLFALFPIWLWGPLAIMTYLDSVALDALRAFRPLLEVDDEVLRRLEYAFTTMPSRPVIISGISWSAIYVVISFPTLPVWNELYPVGPFATAVSLAAGLLSFFTGSAIYYHTFRQLRLVSQIVAKVPRFNLFRLDPVYAFSGLTARTGVAYLFLVSITALTFPLRLNPIPVVAFSILQIALALAAFALPLWSVHRRLLNEKRSLLVELNRQVEAVIGRLHHSLDEDDFSKISGAKDALAGLAAERDVLGKIPTWPWRAGTLTGVLSAVALPIAIFLIQLMLQRWLAR